MAKTNTPGARKSARRKAPARVRNRTKRRKNFKSDKKSAKRMAEIEAALPFAILGFDTDNGGEFLNWHLLNYFTRRRHPVGFTRSRAYRKNDNARVASAHRGGRQPQAAHLRCARHAI